MVLNNIIFINKRGTIYVEGIPELKGFSGINLGNDMIFFWAERD